MRRYPRLLVDRGTRPIATPDRHDVLFDVTLDQRELMAKLQPLPVPRTLPAILSRRRSPVC